MTHNSADIRLTNWVVGTGPDKDGWWQFKANKAPYDRCSTTQTGTLVGLSGLTAGTEYVYTVYAISDVGCAKAIASTGKFTTLSLSLSVSGKTGTAATLNLVNPTDDWWYDRSGDNTCHKASAGTSSISLSGLTPSSSYTYNAYRYEHCLAAHRMTSHSFTTPILYISNAAPTAVTLNIANHSSNWRYKANTGPHSNCSGSQTVSSVNLWGLTANPTYTYTAYSDASCSSALTAKTFNTPQVPEQRISSREIDTTIAATGNAQPEYVWVNSSKTTMWVFDSLDRQIYA